MTVKLRAHVQLIEKNMKTGIYPFSTVIVFFFMNKFINQTILFPCIKN